MTAGSFRATAVPIAGATFATMLGFGMMVPALPLLTAENGKGALASGLLMGAFGFARLLSNVPAGVLVDRVGLRAAAGIGLLVLLAGSLLAIAPLGFAVLMAALALQGAGSALFSTAAMTALILKAGPDRRGAAMSWFQSSLLLAFAVGPLVGGFLTGPFGAHVPFMAQAILAVAALAVVRLLPAAPATKPERASAGVAERLVAPMLLGGAVMGCAAFVARIGAGWTVIPNVGLADLALSPETIGAMVGIGTAANLAVMPLSALGIDRWGAGRTLAAASAATFATLVLMALAPTVPVFWVGTALLMATTGTMIPAAGAVALRGVDRRHTGRAMGLFRTGTDLGMSLGPVAVPGLTAALMLPPAAGFSVAAGAVALAAVIALGLDAARRRAPDALADRAA
ncbi:MFS transporter [Chthonobacter rhizosphaerae]|uniref:MFS transporter n=1 Tax=Chthonobacter rhizosphaerae TaxID=2735553 RepID=UPI0015EE7570|nr:MFS transporter [Chthonobacter rhizosphaerae]